MEDSYYSILEDKNNSSLLEINEKNRILERKEYNEEQLLKEMEEKEKLLLTRTKMLEIAQNRNSYKLKMIYTTLFVSFFIIILILFFYSLVRKRK
jgi:predicted RND superfamily exporter protein